MDDLWWVVAVQAKAQPLVGIVRYGPQAYVICCYPCCLWLCFESMGVWWFGPPGRFEEKLGLCGGRYEYRGLAHSRSGYEGRALVFAAFMMHDHVHIDHLSLSTGCLLLLRQASTVWPGAFHFNIFTFLQPSHAVPSLIRSMPRG